MKFWDLSASLKFELMILATLFLTACGADTYSVSGVVSGLVGSGLVLTNNGGSVAVSTNGRVTLVSNLPNGTGYAITVKTQPTNPSQTCTVFSGSGVIAASNPSNVVVTCITNRYTVGIVVSGLPAAGLTGSALQLVDNGSDYLSVKGNGTYTFATAVASGATYAVTVKSSATNPVETCAVTGGMGTVTNANIINVQVACTAKQFPVGGTVSGAIGSGLIVTNGNDSVTLSATGAFSFPTPVTSGSSYAVAISSQPTSGQNCSFQNGSATGLVTNAEVVSVMIVCRTIGRYLYVADSAVDAIFGYVIDADSGALTGMPQNPIPTGSKPVSLAISPNGRFAYVVNGDLSVSGYSIDGGTGLLTPLAGSPFVLGTVSTDAIAIDQNGLFAYIYDSAGAGSVATYSINTATGALSAVPGGSLTGFGSSLVLEPSGQFAFSLDLNNDNSGYGIEVSGVNLSTGIMTAPTKVAAPAFNDPTFLAVTPNGQFVYATGPDSLLLAYSINKSTGALTAASGSPFAGTGSAGTIQGISIDPGGNFAFLSDCNCLESSSNLGRYYGYRLNGSTAAVTAISATPVAASGVSPGPLVFDVSGKFAFAGNSVSSDISVYSVDASSGALTSIAGSPYTMSQNTSDNPILSLATLQ